MHIESEIEWCDALSEVWDFYHYPENILAIVLPVGIVRALCSSHVYGLRSLAMII